MAAPGGAERAKNVVRERRVVAVLVVVVAPARAVPQAVIPRPVVRWAQRRAGDHRVDYEGARIWHWRSLEDSSVEEAVLEITVIGEPDDALAFSGAVSAYLGELTEDCPSPAVDRLAVSVRWR